MTGADKEKMERKRILITGVAGFIGSHLMSRCLHEGYEVVGVDNFLTGKRENIASVLGESPEFSSRFELKTSDIRDGASMVEASRGCAMIFHEAAIGSVPWSIRDPMLTHETNLTGFLNILNAGRENGIKRVVYASSSAVYGDASDVPGREGAEGAMLSTYASSKFAQEYYAQAWSRNYGLELIGLRYFNVFGARQDPNGAYAAVIPKWLHHMHRGEACVIYGDGESTRDYCHVSNVVEANMLAAFSPCECVRRVNGGFAVAMNIGCGRETSLNALHEQMAQAFCQYFGRSVPMPVRAGAREGDIVRSCADISLAASVLSFSPVVELSEGLQRYVSAFAKSENA